MVDKGDITISKVCRLKKTGAAGFAIWLDFTEDEKYLKGRKATNYWLRKGCWLMRLTNENQATFSGKSWCSSGKTKLMLAENKIEEVMDISIG